MADESFDTNLEMSGRALPLVSIVTIVYNGEQHLEQTIQNIVNQDYKYIEYIIIDGGSTDGTIDIIKRYEPSVAQWVSEVDNGIYDAMNKGLHAAAGDYIMFLNAGDGFANRKTLATAVEEIIENSWPDIVYGNANLLLNNSDKLKELKALKLSVLNLILFGTRTLCHQSIIIKKSIAPPYSTKYKLKGELAWYYDILNIRPKPRVVRLSYPISNYLLGGVSDISFIKNNLERMQVVSNKKGLLVGIISIPCLLIPIIFRLKRIFINK